MQYQDGQVIKQQQNHGVQVEQYHVFHVFQEEVHIEQVKVLLVICVEEVECFLQLRPGEDGCIKLKKNERRYATVSAIAATSSTALVIARGHRIGGISEIPLVVTDDIQSYDKTKKAFQFLKDCRAIEDVRKVKTTKKLRPGRGKTRNRRYKERLGPLIIFKENRGIVRAFRNIPGVDLACVNRLNLLQLAPGGHVGRFIIWTESAFKELNSLFGSYGLKGNSKLHLNNGSPYILPLTCMENTDVERILQSDEIQNIIRPRKLAKKRITRKKNPLKNFFCYG